MAAIDRNVGKKFQKSYFDVLGLCCSSEIPMIEKILNSLDGVKDFSVVVPTKTVIVVHDSLLISQIQIVKALNQARLEANIRAYGETNYKNKWPNPYAVISGVLLLLSFLKFFYSPLRWLALGAVAVGIVPILLKAVSSLRNLRLDINILVLIAVAGSVALHDYWEAGTIVFLFTIAEWLESRASYKATAVMSSLVSVVPQRAVLADTGEEINADEVKLNTIVAVKAGEVIPIDGIVVQGNCEVDEKFLSGESFPVAKQTDSIVWASTINLDGYITVKTTKVAEDCMVARMAKLVEDAQNKKSRTQRFMDKCAKYYTPAIVMISACLAIVPLAFEVHNKKEWYHLSLVVLVSGCPCALLLSTPVAMFCALSKAAKLGVLFKGAEHLETLARVKTMAFDKTGTITRGEFLVADFKPLEANISLNTLIYWTSSIESKSSHPMAAALVDFARANEIDPKPENVEKFQIFPGEGIYGRIEDNEIYVGNWKLASRAGCTEVPKLEGYDVEGKSVGFVFLGSSPVAVFSLSDVCRTGAKEALKELKSKCIKTVMLTGDCHAAANHAQAQLGGAIDIVHAELLPDDKGRLIKELQKAGPVAMIGDGVNDAPALATADVGISMGVSGSALATETGDIVLMSNDIRRIPKALQIAKQVRRKIIENVVISISSKAVILGLAIGGHPLVWAAVLADVGTCLLVIFNSMLILRGITSTTASEHVHKHTTSGGKSSSCYDIESQNYKKCGSVGCRQNEKKCCSSPAKEHGCHGIPSTTTRHVHKHESCGEKSSACFDIESQSKKCSSTDPTAFENKKKCCSSPAKEHNCEGNHHHRHVENGSCGKENTAKEQGNDGNHHRHVENGCCSKENTAKEQGNNGNHHHHHRHVENGCCGKENTAKEQGNDGNHHHHHHRHVEDGCCGKENTAKEHGNDGNHHHHTHPHDEIANCCEKPATNKHSSEGHHHHHPHANNDASRVEKNNCNVTEDGVHFHETTQKQKCCKQATSPTVVHMRDAKACKGSNGCCESFRRECCVRNGHRGTSLAGGLSEIVIE